MKFFDIQIYKHGLATLSLLALLLVSCQDDRIVDPMGGGPSGQPALISLKVTVPEMKKVIARADMTDEDANNVTTLWVGIYNEATGYCTYQHLYTDDDSDFTGGTKDHTEYKLSNISTKSGKSYIVAVANPDRNTGYSMDTDGNIGNPATLSTLLENADTWDKFRAIVIERPLFQDAATLHLPNATENPLPMSGIYYENANGDDALNWTEVGAVNIPAETTGTSLPGRIHLRRPFTQVKFNLKATGNVVSIEPQSYKVYNVPTYSWLYERAEQQGGSVYDYANAGDAMSKGEIGTDINKRYAPSLTYTSTNITNNESTYSFDFWQMENKRTGLEECTDYAHREKEYKKDADGRNSSVYTSLCPTSEETLNNKATFVEIRCRVTYNDSGNLDNPTDAGVNLPSNATRTADVVYTVHLGYVDGDAQDFNCFRNSIYTYNVTVVNVNRIIVEAFLDREDRPDAEGIVMDVTEQVFEVDAHYAARNIYFTADELADFSFSMRAYNNNELHEFYMSEDGTTNAPDDADEKYPYYSWIELAQASENTLVKYPGAGHGTLYRLGEIRQAYQNGDIQAGWFTVFVNEYTYESGSNEGTNWKQYVNQPNRTAYLNVAEHISSDGESSYFKSKYAFSQKSIQTYYNYLDGTADDAIGVEHENETYGMNLRWTVGINNDNIDRDNGRYNVWTHVGGTGGGTSAGLWKDYVQETLPNTVNAITNTNQNAPSRDSKTWSLPMPVLINNTTLTNVLSGSPYDDAYNSQATDYDPQIVHANAQYLEAIRACMNRNRDNNGNGTIDADELRWYLPASGKYVRVILGRNSLSTPIMDYDGNPTLPFGAGTGLNARLHLVSSDGIMVWADEGISSSAFPGRTYGPAPWQVRCIRNLGTDLSTVTRGEKVDPAYDITDIDKTNNTVTPGGGGVVKVKHYYGSALRDYTAGTLPMHKTNSPYNKLGQYGFEIAPRGNTADVTTGLVVRDASEATVSFANNNNGATLYQTSVNNATPCEYLNTRTGRLGWRVPNQKELVIMRRSGLLTFGNGDYFMGCTQEYWQNVSSGQAGSTSQSFTDYRITTVRSDNATSQPYNNIGPVRCVRDLTPAEANMTYAEIKEYHPNN